MIRVDVCVGCGAEFEQELKQGRPRTYCETCKPPKVPRVAPVAPGLKADPPVRADGRCAECGGPRKITKEARRYAGVQIDMDPFCSSRCCRRFHGCEVRGDDGEFDSQAAFASGMNDERKRAKGIAA